MTSEKNASALNDIKRKHQRLICFFLCLAIPGVFLLSQNLFLVATVRFSSEKLRLDDVEESSSSKDIKSLWIDIVFGVKVRIVCLFYASVQLSVSFKQMITDIRFCGTGT